MKEVILRIRVGREAYESSRRKKEPEIGETGPEGSVVVEQMREGSFRFKMLMIRESGDDKMSTSPSMVELVGD